MLRLRLKRTGRKGEPHYRVVVMQSTNPRDGMAVEEVGYYNPRTQPSTFTVKEDRVKYWLSQGAQPTTTVRAYLVKAGLMEAPRKGSKKPVGKKKKKESSQED